MRLAPKGTSVRWGGRILIRNQDRLTLNEADMKDIRGRRIAMVFQYPMASLNSVMTIGAQIDDILCRQTDVSRRTALSRTVKLLDLVGIRDPALRADVDPHQFSGDMRQRVMIAVACRPDLLIADEPTTALDVTCVRLDPLHSAPPVHRIYVIRSAKPAPEFKAVEASSLAIAGRSLATLIHNRGKMDFPRKSQGFF